MYLLLLALLPGIHAVYDLNMMALIPFDGSWYGGLVVRQALQIGIRDVNERGILDGYRLKFTYKNSGCKPGKAVNALMEHIYEGEGTKFMLIGPICSSACELVAHSARHWNVTHISSGCGTPALSNKTTYPNFMRTNSPQLMVNPALVDFIKQHMWKKICLIYENHNLYTLSIDHLKVMFIKENITVIRDEIVTDVVYHAVKNLKDYQCKILYVNMYQGIGKRVFCEMYKNDMYGPRHVNIFPNFWEEDWWLLTEAEQEEYGCTNDQMYKAVEAAIGVGRLGENNKEERGIANMTISEYFARLRQELRDEHNLTKDPFGMTNAPKAYDAIWTIALGLKNALAKMKQLGWTRGPENFTYGDYEMTKLILGEMKKVQFLGVKGRIQFTPEGDAFTLGFLTQVQRGVEKMIAILYPDKEEIGRMVDWRNDTPIYWPGGKVPKDSLLVLTEMEYVPASVYTVIAVLAVVGIIITLVILTFNIYHRKKRIIRMSSPNLNNSVLIGCIMMFMAVFFTNTVQFGDSIALICKIPTVLAVCGFSIAFGSLFSKIFRVHRIFVNKNLKRRIVKDWMLFTLVIVCLVIDAAVLIVWEIVSPQELIVQDISSQFLDEDTQLIRQVAVCDSRHSMAFLGVIYGVQGILLIFGAFLAYETRKVKVAELNDSQQIGVCIYNVIILSLIAVGMGFALEKKITLIYLVKAICIILGTTLTQAIIFVPKMMALLGNPNSVDAESIGTVTGTMPSLG